MKRNQMSAGLKMMLEKAPYDPVSAFNAALLLEEEHKGPQAVQYFYLRAAEGGYAPAMLKLASLYIMGRYVCEGINHPCTIQDIQTGVSWIQRAANTGDSTAVYMLAHCYFEGIGVDRSSVNGKYLMRQVAFADFSINPYEPTETLIFGCMSNEIRLYLHGQQRIKPRSLAG